MPLSAQTGHCLFTRLRFGKSLDCHLLHDARMTVLRAAVRALHPDTRAVRSFRTARKRFYRQMLCAHAARQAAGDKPTG